MNAFVFCGPTIASADVGLYLDATLLAPASQGDLYRAAQHRPAMIGIIDGCFHHVPSVWHKEILWALSEGIPVYGGASMGALRAAELAPFGMRGVGKIFEDVASGRARGRRRGGGPPRAPRGRLPVTIRSAR